MTHFTLVHLIELSRMSVTGHSCNCHVSTQALRRFLTPQTKDSSFSPPKKCITNLRLPHNAKEWKPKEFYQY